jgi:hypothetical protein
MTRPVAEILADIYRFPPPTDILRGWQPFAELVQELRTVGGLPGAIPDLLRYFEEHPTARLIGWLWEVAHALERLPGQYEAAVLESVRRRPSDFAVRLAGRFAEARGKLEIGATQVLETLDGSARRDDVPELLHETIRRVVRTCCQPAGKPNAAPEHSAS